MKLAIVTFMFILGSCLCLGAVSDALQSQLITQSTIKNIRQPEPRIFSAGQPTKADLLLLQQAGIRHIINLRPVNEQQWNEQAEVVALGMHYHDLAVAGADDINETNAKALAAMLAEIEGEPVLLHCASGNRVGALIAMIEAKLKAKPVEQAIAEGQRWGLSSLSATVADKLTAP